MVHERDPRILRIEDMVRRLLRRNADVHLANALEKMHAAEVAQMFNHMEPEERIAVFRVVESAEHKAEILTECDAHIVRGILDSQSNEDIVQLLKPIDSDEMRYLLGTLSDERANEVLALLEHKEAEAVGELMAYSPDTAGGIMTDSYFALPEEMTVEEAVAEVRKMSEVDYVFYVYVVGADKQLRGVVSLRQLLLSNPSQRLSEIMASNVWSVNVHEDQERVARLVSRYNILAIPVVDDDRVLVGIVTVDDVLDVLREEATEDMLKMAGTHTSEEITSLSPGRMAWARFPWLFVSWIGGILAAGLIIQFEHELSRVVALTAFLPVIIGMAGNVGTQSATIMVRGIATGRVDPKAWFRIVFRQLLVGMILGVAYGVLLGALALFQYQSMMSLGLVVGLSICLVMVLSSIMASFLPLVLHRFGFDPAVATGPFVTTGVDVLGILIYFSIARLLLF
ncbi:MAG: magnesium transporter [bacterium]|nr:magnesium transporter [bacterium]